MRTVYLVISLFILPFCVTAQSVSLKLEAAVDKMMGDSQLKNGLVSIYIVNSNTGAVVYSKNATVGLAAASSQKVITAATAFELLGKNYRFKTDLGYSGEIKNGGLTGNLFVTGYGDPTLGSWRYAANKEEPIFKSWLAQLKKNNINKINGNVYLDGSAYEFQPISGGWIWDDMGNYYGAGHYGINWHENQYDLFIKSGDNVGDKTQIVRSEPELQVTNMVNQLTTAKKGSGDNAYIYLPPYSNTGFINGTIPAGEKAFKISGSFPNPSDQLQQVISSWFKQSNLLVTGKYESSFASIIKGQNIPKPAQVIYTHYSPPLDSIIYWFIKKSINLYGEALLKTLAYEKEGFGSTERGISLTYDFWKNKGIDSTSIKMFDGSGLSPQNRITTEAFVKVMQYAITRPWFPSFYNALPEYNGLKMKSGTIGGTKSFTGYAKSKAGTEYTFAIIVSNYHGSSAQVVQKMYTVLDVLK